VGPPLPSARKRAYSASIQEEHARPLVAKDDGAVDGHSPGVGLATKNPWALEDDRAEHLLRNERAHLGAAARWYPPRASLAVA
jgi:hypothetical protein